MGSDMELCFNVRTFFSTVYPFRSFLIPLGRTCTPSIDFRFSPLYNADRTIKRLFIDIEVRKMLLRDAKIGRTYTVKSIHLPFQLERRLEAKKRRCST